MISLALIAAAGCLTLPAGAGRVTAGDLAPAFAGLGAVPPETVVSFAPEPGLERVFQRPELRRIAAQFNLAQAPEDEICVTRAVAPLDPATMLAAMRKELPEAKIAILEFSKQPAPQGEITFRRIGLRGNSASGAFWYGSVRYAPNRDFAIWAKVTVTAPISRLVAKRDIAPGQRLDPDDVAIETHDAFPSPQSIPASAAMVAGKISRVAVPAGAPVLIAMLDNAKDVRQGDIVAVEVRDGGAHLMLEARAEASGSVGSVIAVRNPMSGRRFMAKVQSRGRVFVDCASPQENQ